jgi:rubrerythrin
MTWTLIEFLAHAIAMEQEAADRYLELADMMEAHRNDAVAMLFRDMNRFSTMHHDSIRDRAKGLELPRLKSWEYRWRSSPEVGDEAGFDYMVEPYNALRYARRNEVRAMKYYRAVADEAQDEDLRRMASDFAEEERGHARSLDEWIARTPRPSMTWDEDPESLEPVD